MRAVVKEDGSGLEWLVVRVGGLVGAVTHVREGTLVAALKGWGEFGGEGGGEGDEMRGVGVEGGEGGEGGEGSEGEDGARWKGRDDGERGKGRDEGEEKPSMMQILVWRSEGMGAYMAEELGEKFRIPKGFY